MYLFWFSKLQYFFYAGLSMFFHLVFLLYRKTSTRILIQKGNGILIACIWMATIFIPSIVECSSLFGFQEIRKIKDSGPMFGKSTFQKSGEVYFHRIQGWIKGQNFIFECLYEPCGRFASCSDIGQRERKPISKPRTKESTDNGATNANYCYFVGTKLQFYSYVFDGCLVGLIIGYVLIRFIFWLIFLRTK